MLNTDIYQRVFNNSWLNYNQSMSDFHNLRNRFLLIKFNHRILSNAEVSCQPFDKYIQTPIKQIYSQMYVFLVLLFFLLLE